MTRHPPTIDCRLSYRRGGKGEQRASRAAYVEALAQRLRGVVYHSFNCQVDRIETLARSNATVWTEAVQQGGDEVRDFLVEVTPSPDVVFPDEYVANAPMITVRLVEDVVRAAVLTAEASPQFPAITVWSRLPNLLGATVSLDNNMVVRTWGALTLLTPGTVIRAERSVVRIDNRLDTSTP